MDFHREGVFSGLISFIFYRTGSEALTRSHLQLHLLQTIPFFRFLPLPFCVLPLLCEASTRVRVPFRHGRTIESLGFQMPRIFFPSELSYIKKTQPTKSVKVLTSWSPQWGGGGGIRQEECNCQSKQGRMRMTLQPGIFTLHLVLHWLSTAVQTTQVHKLAQPLLHNNLPAMASKAWCHHPLVLVLSLSIGGL